MADFIDTLIGVYPFLIGLLLAQAFVVCRGNARAEKALQEANLVFLWAPWVGFIVALVTGALNAIFFAAMDVVVCVLVASSTIAACTALALGTMTATNNVKALKSVSSKKVPAGGKDGHEVSDAKQVESSSSTTKLE